MLSKVMRSHALILWSTSILFLWTSLSSILTAQNNVDDWVVQHFQAARQAQVEGKLEKAVEEYQLVLKKHPEITEIYVNLGVVYYQQRNYPAAADTLKTAVARNPGLLGAQVFLGICRYMMGDFKNAVDPLERALQIEARDRQAGIYLGLTHLAMEQPEKAARQLRKTRSYYPEDIEVIYHLGEAYSEIVRQSSSFLKEFGENSALYHWAAAISAEQKGEMLWAVENYMKALALDPHIPEVNFNLAVALQRTGFFELAASSLKRYALLNPSAGLAESFLAGIELAPPLEQSVLREREKAFRALWERVPAPSSTPFPLVADEFVNRALADYLGSGSRPSLKAALDLYLQGDYGAAARQLEVNLPDHWAAVYLLVRAYVMASEYEAAQRVLEERLVSIQNIPSIALLKLEVGSPWAMQCFNRVVTKEPDSFRARLLQAKWHAAAYRPEDAIAEYHEIFKRFPGRVGIQMALGKLYAEKRDWPSAIKAYEAELSLNPHNLPVLARLGHAYAEGWRPDEAIAALTKFLQVHPKDDRAYADLGKAWSQKGDSLQAIQAYEGALQYGATDENLHYRLFQLYKKTGDAARAQEHLAKFKKAQAEKKARE